MIDLDDLNARFAIQDVLVFQPGGGGLPIAKVENEAASALVSLQGAQLLRWDPHGEQPVIWLSEAANFTPGKSIRGGVPVCWPWFGVHPSEAEFPAHGYARTVPWEVLATESSSAAQTRLVMRLVETVGTRAWWPHNTPLEYHITVGEALELELVTGNAGNEPVTIGEALHTYFQVGDVARVQVLGLEDGEYLDKVDGFKRRTQSGPVLISGEVDRVYVNNRSACVISDPVLQRRILIDKRGSDATVVWNPWIDKAEKMGDLGDSGYRQMLCVESANAADNLVNIAPGGEHRLWVSYRVER
jgi:D-hexose-6-phosphate mutarotase